MQVPFLRNGRSRDTPLFFCPSSSFYFLPFPADEDVFYSFFSLVLLPAWTAPPFPFPPTHLLSSSPPCCFFSPCSETEKPGRSPSFPFPLQYPPAVREQGTSFFFFFLPPYQRHARGFPFPPFFFPGSEPDARFSPSFPGKRCSFFFLFFFAVARSC